MKSLKFSNEKTQFVTTLKSRVNTLFQSNGLSKTANTEMKLKSVTAFAIYLIPYFVMMMAAPSNLLLLFGLWIFMGLGMAIIGTSVMHDSLHGSYSKKKRVNYIMGMSAWLVGADATIWKFQHNVLHHTYTNIEHADEDIDPRFVLRFSPNQPRRWFHRFQHIYALFFYSISTLLWVTIKDFIKAFNYRKKGLVKSGELSRVLIIMVLRKASYHFLFLVLPILVLPVSTGLILTMFICMHLTAGLLLSLIFQPAHVIPTSTFIEPKDTTIQQNWYVHQLYTTSNFGLSSRLIFWFTGGLNHQIEHHLFPNICHIHYRKIGKIVRETTKEFGMPYHNQKTFWLAISNHFRMLKTLGRGAI